MDAYVFYFRSTINFPSWTSAVSRVRSRNFILYLNKPSTLTKLQNSVDHAALIQQFSKDRSFFVDQVLSPETIELWWGKIMRRKITKSHSRRAGPNCPKKERERIARCRLHVAYEFSVALTHFLSEHWRKIRASRGFERDFR